MKKLFILLLFPFLLYGSCPLQPKTKGCGGSVWKIGKESGVAGYGEYKDYSDQSIWGGFSCPKNVKNVNGTDVILGAKIKDLNFNNGNYICEYFDENNAKYKIADVCNYNNQSCNEEYKKVKTSKPSEFKAKAASSPESFGLMKTTASQDQIFEWSFSNLLSKIAATISNMFKSLFTSGPGTFQFSWNDQNNGLYNVYNQVKKELKKVFNKDKESDTLIDIPKIAKDTKLLDGVMGVNGVQASPTKLSGFIAGVVTSDSDIVKGVDASGSIMYTDKIKNELFDTNEFKSVDIFAGLKFAKIADKGKELATSYADIFDKKTWGYFLTWNYNFNLIFSQIIMYVFMLGGGFLILYIGYMRVVTNFTKEEEFFRHDTYNRLILAVVAFVVFTSPMLKTDIDMSANPMVLPDSQKAQNQNNYTEYSTVYQSFIQYFAQISNHFADAVSAGSVYSFASYLNAKNHMFLNDIDYFKMISSNYLSAKIADNEARYYKEMCVPVHELYWKQHDGFVGTKTELLTNEFRGVGDSVSDDLLANYGYKTIGLPFCQDLARRASLDTTLAIKGYMNVNHDLAQVVGSGLDNYKIVMESVTTNMFRNENILGWMNIVSVPFSYYLYENGDMFLGQEGSNIKEKELNSLVENFDYEDSVVNRKLLGIIDANEVAKAESATSKALGTIVGYQVLGMFPGFSELRKGIMEMAQETQKNSSKKEKAPIRTKSKLSSWIEKYNLGSNLKTLGATAMSYFVAAKIYILGLSLLSTFMIIVLGILRVVFYFINLLKYFIVSPIVVLWSLTTGQGGKSISFLGQGLVLMFQPMLIVVSVSIYMFIIELLHTIWFYVMGMIVKGTTVNLEEMAKATSNNVVDEMSSMMMLNSLDIIGDVLILFVSIYVGYKIIFSDEWFMKLVGYDGNIVGAGSTRSAGESVASMLNPAR